jgi:hypothetical protein
MLESLIGEFHIAQTEYALVIVLHRQSLLLLYAGKYFNGLQESCFLIHVLKIVKNGLAIMRSSST